MGGRGSAVNVVNTYGEKYGVRMTPNQYKSSVNAEANFIFKNIEVSEPVQIIIKRSFRHGVLVAQIASDGDKILSKRGMTDRAIQDLENLMIRLEISSKAARADMQNSKTWSGFDEARAKLQANNQISKQLDDALKKLKKK